MTVRRTFYHPELDALRFFAFLAVFFHHAFPRDAQTWVGILGDTWGWRVASALDAGGFGVDLFFVLSSFLITSLLLREKDARGTIDIPAFWIRRALRIWPLYYVFLFACAIVERLPFRFVASYAVFLGNWGDLAWGFPYSAASLLWSVSVEEQFYLTWPLVVLIVPRRRLGWVCAGLLLAAFATRGYLAAHGVPHPGIWRNTIARLDPIALGALIALHGARVPRWPLALRGAAVAFATLTIVFVMHRYHPYAPAAPRHVVTYFVVAAACGLILLAVLGLDVRSRAIIYLGRISYGLYVFHVAALYALDPLGLPMPARAALGFAITVSIAALSYRFLEAPFLRMKDRFTYIVSGPMSPGVVPGRHVPATEAPLAP